MLLLFFILLQAYFPWETKMKNKPEILKDKSLKSVFIFLKEYDICPSAVTKSTAYLLFNEVVDT